MRKTNISRGQVISELLIALAIFSLIVTPFLSSLVNLMDAQIRYRHRIQASQYAQEALEVAYNLAVNTDNWESFAAYAVTSGLAYYPTYTADGHFTLMPGVEPPIEGKFRRKITFSKAWRDTEGNITDDPSATEDKNTVRVNSVVAWEDRGKTQEVNLITYLINFEAI